MIDIKDVMIKGTIAMPSRLRIKLMAIWNIIMDRPVCYRMYFYREVTFKFINKAIVTECIFNNNDQDYEAALKEKKLIRLPGSKDTPVHFL